MNFDLGWQYIYFNRHDTQLLQQTSPTDMTPTLNCEPFLQRQIDLIQPKAILAVGRVAAQNLLKTDVAVGKLRGREDANKQKTPTPNKRHSP